MPLVRIALRAGVAAAEQHAIADAVHQALVDTIGIAPADRFQLISEHTVAQFIYNPSYLDITRTDRLVMLQITISLGRTINQKRALYHRIAELLGERAGVRAEDVLISLVEVAKENWSFGLGLAQYVPE